MYVCMYMYMYACRQLHYVYLLSLYTFSCLYIYSAVTVALHVGYDRFFYSVVTHVIVIDCMVLYGINVVTNTLHTFLTFHKVV